MDDVFPHNAWTDHDLISLAVLRVALEMKLFSQICALKKATLDLSLYNRQSGFILMMFFSYPGWATVSTKNLRSYHSCYECGLHIFIVAVIIVSEEGFQRVF